MNYYFNKSAAGLLIVKNQCFVCLTDTVGLYSFYFIVSSFPCLFSLLQGTIGFEQHIDKCLDLSQYLYNKIKNREGYEMVFDGVVSLPLLYIYIRLLCILAIPVL